MKKFLFITLFSIMSVFMLSGCAEEEETPTTPPATTPDLSDIKTLVGTYEIEFFYTDVQIATLTNDCAKVPVYVTNKKCGTNDSSSKFAGEGTITYDETKQEIQIVTKVQMAGGTFDYVKENISDLAYLVDPNKYNFTVYNDIPVSEIKDGIINKDGTIKGVTGRNATKKTSEDALNNTYTLTIGTDGVITSNMTDKSSLMSADVVVRMKKVSDTVEKLDPNTAFPTPDISDVFKKDVGYIYK